MRVLLNTLHADLVPGGLLKPRGPQAQIHSPVTSLAPKRHTCAVCLEDGARTQLRCGHVFHAACVVQCAKQSSRCPLCRALVENQGDRRILQSSLYMSGDDLVISVFTVEGVDGWVSRRFHMPRGIRGTDVFERLYEANRYNLLLRVALDRVQLNGVPLVDSFRPRPHTEDYVNSLHEALNKLGVPE